MQRAPNQTVFAVGEDWLIHSFREQCVGFLKSLSIERHQDLFGVARHFLHYASNKCFVEAPLIRLQLVLRR